MEDKDNGMELTLYGHTYRLYTQSFLCYGQDQFLRRLMARLVTVTGHMKGGSQALFFLRLLL